MVHPCVINYSTGLVLGNTEVLETGNLNGRIIAKYQTETPTAQAVTR